MDKGFLLSLPLEVREKLDEKLEHMAEHLISARVAVEAEEEEDFLVEIACAYTELTDLIEKLADIAEQMVLTRAIENERRN